MRRANPIPALAVQAAIALLLGMGAMLLVRLAGPAATTIVLVVLLALFFYALLSILRAALASRRWGHGPWPRWLRRRGRGTGGNAGRGGGSAGVREPRRPRWPGFPPRSAAAEPEGAERTI